MFILAVSYRQIARTWRTSRKTKHFGSVISLEHHLLRTLFWERSCENTLVRTLFWECSFENTLLRTLCQRMLYREHTFLNALLRMFFRERSFENPLSRTLVLPPRPDSGVPCWGCVRRCPCRRAWGSSAARPAGPPAAPCGAQWTWCPPPGGCSWSAPPARGRWPPPSHLLWSEGGVGGIGPIFFWSKLNL